MSTETAELPALGDAFTNAMKEGSGDFQLPADSPLAKTVAEPVKTDAAPVKEKEGAAPVKEKEATKAEAEPAKKKSALDAALADEAEPAKDEPDEVAQLLESKDPNWAKAREAMKRLSEEVKTYKEQATKAATPAPEVLAQVNEYKAKVEKLEKENAQYRDSIIALDVRFDPSTQQKIAVRDKQAASLAERVKEAGGNAEAFMEALGLPLAKRGRAIDAALADIESARELSSINAKLATIEQADEELDEMMAKPHETFEQMKQRREVQAREQHDKIEQFKVATFENVKKELPKLSKLMRMAPEDSEGAKEFNDALLSDLQKAPQMLEAEPRDAAVYAYKAARYDSVEKIALSLHSKVAELEAELAKFHGAEPGFRGGGKTKAKADYEMPLEKAFFDAMNGQAPV